VRAGIILAVRDGLLDFRLGIALASGPEEFMLMGTAQSRLVSIDVYSRTSLNVLSVQVDGDADDESRQTDVTRQTKDHRKLTFCPFMKT
jgi:hypothetical protein